jgi:hypothetical protein
MPRYYLKLIDDHISSHFYHHYSVISSYSTLYFVFTQVLTASLNILLRLLLLLHYSSWWALASRFIGFLDNEIFFQVSGRQPNAPTPILEDQWAALCLVPAFRPVWLGWPYQELSSRQHSSQGRNGTHKPPRHDKAAAPREALNIL